MEVIFFDGWEGIIRVAISTIAAYISVVFMLRISGKRTLAKMNAFDTVVTIALGSILGSMILNKSTPIAEGLFATALLIVLQYLITSLSVRSKTFENAISSSATLLYYNGDFLDKIMKKERVTKTELNKSVREAGFSSYDEVNAVILESTGDITVISKISGQSAMEDIKNI